MKSLVCATLMVLPTVVFGGVKTTVYDHILPAHVAFATASQAMVAATGDCDLDEMRMGYHAVFDAWMGVSHIQFGPVEVGGLSLAIAFWPDPKNQTEKALLRLIADEDEAVEVDAEFAEVSVAAQGIMALENMLYAGRELTPYSCALTQAIAVRLAENAIGLEAVWRADHVALMTHPGPDNPAYASQAEVLRVLYTALSTGLEFLHDQRLGRPLGSFDRPRPARAEARRSERSLRNIQLSLLALEGLAVALAGDTIPATRAAFSEARARAEALDDQALQGVSTPIGRLRVEVLQQKVAEVQVAVAEEIGAALGVRAGFNSLDGD